jgi:hypothetical protein
MLVRHLIDDNVWPKSPQCLLKRIKTSAFERFVAIFRGEYLSEPLINVATALK